jgi:hypothetical protein
MTTTSPDQRRQEGVPRQDEVRAFLRELFAGLPDLSLESYKFARGNEVAERWFIRGRTGYLMGCRRADAGLIFLASGWS